MTAPEGDRLRMEAALPPEMLRALAETCRAHGIPPSRWHRVPAIARPYETVACVALAERLQREDGLAWKAAVLAAAVRLGLNDDTILSRLRRAFGDAYGLG